MPTCELLLYSTVFFLSLWLGFYLIARDIQKRPLRLTGLGLGFYAGAIFLEAVQATAPPELQLFVSSFPNIFLYLPALLWTGGLVSLIPETHPQKDQANRLWAWLVFPLTLLAVLIHGLFGFSPLILTLTVSLPLAGAYVYLLNALQKIEEKLPLGLVLLATIFFGLAVGIALPFTWLPRLWVLLSIGLDLLLLGWGIAIFDAFEEGHRLRTDMVRSLLTSLLLTLLFVVQIALVAALEEGMTFGMIVLLFSVISTSVAAVTLPKLLREIFPGLFVERDEQTRLQNTAEAMDRLAPGLDTGAMTEADFQRLTRRAISYLGDLPRLAASPLTFLPVVETRIRERGGRLDTLERAHELKTLLTESIQRLKPAGGTQTGTGEAWRYYNALYYPYVLGLKPHRRYRPEEISPEDKMALDWFRADVPERTLHNWQTAAAKLVAQDLMERNESE